ncbi:hypothetical protein LWI28_004218 [Acer negundo]|uniref:Protein kinase domain-containing protein n=1 Tax=Acer negundo TaxID=4023 RepID=A0AAD5I5H1_ACENE|nr:hypothetical protein LWI28_004218 [Acer negundo]
MNIPIHVMSYVKLLAIVLVLISTVMSSCFVLSTLVSEDDVKCLKGVKSLLKDPELKLSSWSFTNSSVAFLCQFDGVSCWNDRENRIINLELQGMNLSGHVPQSLQYCQSLQKLDLSDNKLSGTIPRQICSWLPYLVTLNLSNNDITGSIPPELGNCIYLNTLILSYNSLSGHIPYQLSYLVRLKVFSVAYNNLSGEIPQFYRRSSTVHLSIARRFSVDPYRRLPVDPLESKLTGRLNKRNIAIIVAAGAFGATVSLLSSFALVWRYHFRYVSRRKASGYGIGRDDHCCGVEYQLRTHQLVEVSLFKTPIVKVRLADLMKATNSFNAENIIASTSLGTTYKAVLLDGSVLAIKQLNNTCKLGEKHFRSEVNRLGLLRHPNLAPLLGFCVVGEEKLLVYKHMSNGTLYSLLHESNAELDWPTRFRIGFGAARGLAWLHHECQPQFLHQNICSNVILVDEDFDARIMDFGLARLMTSSGDLEEFGYIAAPQYSSITIPSLRGDVYGLGIVLLELVTGQKPIKISTADEGFKENLADWVNQLSKTGRIKDAIDLSLRGKGYDEEMLQFLRIASNCVVSKPKNRWTMYQVYQSLNSIAEKHGLSELYSEFSDTFCQAR